MKYLLIFLFLVSRAVAQTPIYDRLSRLLDARILTPTDGQVLTWDSTTSRWRNEAAPGSGSGDALVANPLTQFSGILPTNAEFNFVDGVTSSIQTQLNNKVTLNGAGGTPSSLTLTNATGLQLGSIVGFGADVADYLAIEYGLTGSILVKGGAIAGTTGTFSGAVTAASFNGLAITPTTATFMVPDGTTIIGPPNGGTLATTSIPAAGAASVPALNLTGVPFAGTGTTSFPLVYINDANATASTTLNTDGTYFGVNGDGTQDLMNLLKDGTSVFKVSSTGAATATSLALGGATIGSNALAVNGIAEIGSATGAQLFVKSTAASGNANAYAYQILQADTGSGSLMYRAFLGLAANGNHQWIAGQFGDAADTFGIRVGSGDTLVGKFSSGLFAVTGAITASGTVTIGNGTLTSGGAALGFASDPLCGWYRNSASQWTWFTGGNTSHFSLIAAQVRVSSSTVIGWGSGSSETGADTTISRLSAGVIGVQGLTASGNLITATQTPASAAAAGTAGTITWDANFIYICTATNTWKRVAIATW